MKIFQLIQKPQLRGAEMFASQLSSNLESMGDCVYLISLFPGDAELPFNGQKIELDRPLKRRFFDVKGWKLLAHLIKLHQPDIIQANAADTLKFAVFSKIVYGWKTPIVYRNANKMGDFIKTRFQLILNKFLVHRAAFVVSVSHECEIDFRKTFQFPPNKIKTVQIGIEPYHIGKFPVDLSHLESSYPIITNVAGFVPEKNHKGLIRIFSAIIRDHPKAKLLLIGKGRLEDEITAIIKEKALSASIIILGYRTDVLEIVKGSDVFLMPSLIEGLPAVILEAMYCETPVVASHVGGIGEIVKTGETGWLIEKNNEQGFVEAVNSILSNKNSTVSVTANALQMTVNDFMNDSIAKRFRTIYQEFEND